MTTRPPVRVAIADDQELVRTGFRLILEAEPDLEVVGEAGDGRAALDVAVRRQPDVVLMDIQMPDMDGIEATRRLLGGGAGDAGAAGPEATRVVILTTFERDDYIVGALRAGASGFLLKNAPPEDLVAAVRVVAQGDALLSPSVTRRILSRLADGSPDTATAARLGELTERETEVLRLVAGGLSNAEIAGRLVLGEATVKTHVSRVLMKLHLRDRVQAVVFAYESGLVRPGGAPDRRTRPGQP